MRARGLALGVAVFAFALAGCAASPRPAKARELTPAERDGLSAILEPILAAAGLWRGSGDGCAAAFGVLEGDAVGIVLAPHAPCRVRLVLTEATLARLDRGTLRVLLAHEVAHLQLGHPDARQARADARKQTQQGIKSASRAGSTAAGLIPGIGSLVSKGIGTARKAATAAMEMHGNPYLPGEEEAADALAAAFLNEVEPSDCRGLVILLRERLRSPDEEPWAPWLRTHPVSAERIQALVAPCPGAASP
jgi:Zn-dependent protease with chaperone function